MFSDGLQSSAAMGALLLLDKNRLYFPPLKGQL
jgi:hypothetical protein